MNPAVSSAICAAIAAAGGLPVKEVLSIALSAYAAAQRIAAGGGPA